jgi:hypothetical protein
VGDGLGAGLEAGAAGFGAFHVLAFIATVALGALPEPLAPVTFPQPAENITVTIPARMVIPAHLRIGKENSSSLVNSLEETNI